MPIHNAVRLAPRILLLAVLSWTSTTGLGQEIIVDNRDTSTYQTGDWRTSSGEFPYLEDSVYSVRNDQIFGWYPNLPYSGDWEVYAWWTYHPNRSNSVPYRIRDFNDTDVTVFVNQRDRYLSGRWILLGQFSLQPQEDGPDFRVTVSSENGQANADALRFVYVEGPKEWPEIRCPCDEYFSRAADLYVGWGGSFQPQDLGSADVQHECPKFGWPKRTYFKTSWNAGTPEEKWVSLLFTNEGDPSEFNAWSACHVQLRSNQHPSAGAPEYDDLVYNEYVSYLKREAFRACNASITDFCIRD